jgi:hypothetical protein
MIPGALWYDGHAYFGADIIAHQKADDPPLPTFLRPEGVARQAVGLPGSEEPGPWDTALPVYRRAGTPTSEALVARFTLVGDRSAYVLYWEFRRE